MTVSETLCYCACCAPLAGSPNPRPFIILLLFNCCDTALITGFNTDIEHGGVTYHVQTEDKGLENPIILSLVYVGGAILASKRTPYNDLISEGFDEKALIERLNRQHKLIIAAIRAGRIEDLKRMGARDGGASSTAEQQKPVETAKRAEPEIVEEIAKASDAGASSSILDLLTGPEVPIIPEGIEISRGYDFATEIEAAPAPILRVETFAETFAVDVDDEDDDDLYLNLIDDEGEFRGGQLATIRIYAGRGKFGGRSVPAANVTVKVLGTTFRPIILSTQTDDKGIAVVRALLPHFTSGRAAILIRVTDATGETAELRRVIQQS